MIRVQIFCDVCKSSLDVVTSAQKVLATATGFNELHSGLCFIDQEVQSDGGEDEEVARGAEAGRDESGGSSTGGSGEDGTASSPSGQRIGRA